MEAQSFGVALSFGGPFCGVIATKEQFVRQMPGRLVGQTVDGNGNRGFVLTLATREQHIRREKATSNICTNQALVALMATIFLTVYGKEGIRELAEHNLAKAAYAARRSAHPAKAVFTARRASTSSSSQNEACSSRSPRPASAPTSCRRSMCPLSTRALLGAAHRDPRRAARVSEIEIIRHFTRLSTWNYAIDLGMYPLGSCTMKYNPRVNEFVARIEGLAEAHPYRPDSLAQGILEVIDLLQRCLLEITGMDAITLQPAAGAHGEFTGILLVRAWHESQGNPRKKILIPDSAHGTNPPPRPSAATRSRTSSPTPKAASTSKRSRAGDEETAALMLTNPSTIGVFESQIHKIAEISTPRARCSTWTAPT
jgi:glycine cleavage system protein P-like pyridoxal-binding family